MSGDWFPDSLLGGFIEGVGGGEGNQSCSGSYQYFKK